MMRYEAKESGGRDLVICVDCDNDKMKVSFIESGMLVVCSNYNKEVFHIHLPQHVLEQLEKETASKLSRKDTYHIFDP
jgi:hypothetical protein